MTTPKFEAVIKIEDSSMIAGIQYDPMTKTMDAQFRNGGVVYRYNNITHLEFSMLVTKESTGKAFHAMIHGQKKCVKTRRAPFVVPGTSEE